MKKKNFNFRVWKAWKLFLCWRLKKKRRNLKNVFYYNVHSRFVRRNVDVSERKKVTQLTVDTLNYLDWVDKHNGINHRNLISNEMLLLFLVLCARQFPDNNFLFWRWVQYLIDMKNNINRLSKHTLLIIITNDLEESKYVENFHLIILLVFYRRLMAVNVSSSSSRQCVQVWHEFFTKL